MLLQAGDLKVGIDFLVGLDQFAVARSHSSVLRRSNAWFGVTIVGVPSARAVALAAFPLHRFLSNYLHGYRTCQRRCRRLHRRAQNPPSAIWRSSRRSCTPAIWCATPTAPFSGYWSAASAVTASTRGQWYFLRVLWITDGLSQRELSARVGMMEPTTVIALRSMRTLGPDPARTQRRRPAQGAGVSHRQGKTAAQRAARGGARHYRGCRRTASRRATSRFSAASSADDREP